jgi:hypothetical protein
MSDEGRRDPARAAIWALLTAAVLWESPGLPFGRLFSSTPYGGLPPGFGFDRRRVQGPPATVLSKVGPL